MSSGVWSIPGRDVKDCPRDLENPGMRGQLHGRKGAHLVLTETFCLVKF